MKRKINDVIKKKELFVTTEPTITSYSYHALPLCIIEAEDKIGDEVASFEIKGCGNNEWLQVGNWNKNGNVWSVSDKSDYGENSNACLYHKITTENDYIHISVEKQRYSGPWAAINLFVTDSTEDIEISDNEYLYRFCYFVYDGAHYYSKGREESIKNFVSKENKGYDLVLNLTNSFIEVYGGSKTINLLGKKEIQFDKKKDLYLGIQVKHGNNTYYPWFYSNFISLSSDVKCRHRRLDYVSMSKHWIFNRSNYFLDIAYETAEDILDLGGHRYIKSCINKGKYIELKLNQYFLEGREEYKKEHHIHQNLIYGFDDKKKVFHLLGYQNNGKLAKFTIRYSELNKSLKKYRDEKVNIIQYAEDGYPYSFKSQYLKRKIQEYLDGVCSSASVELLMQEENRKHGINIYGELKSDKGLEVLIADRRVSYVLWEHKYHMKGRIKYLANQGVYQEEQRDELLQEIEPIIDICFNLRNIVHKYQIRPEKTDRKLLVTWLEEVERRERGLLEKMLDYWR